MNPGNALNELRENSFSFLGENRKNGFRSNIKSLSQ